MSPFTYVKWGQFCLIISLLLQTADGSFYVFRGDQYWKVKLTAAGVYPGYPRTTKDWSGLPGNVDAAFYNPADKMTYIFRKNQGRFEKY